MTSAVPKPASVGGAVVRGSAWTLAGYGSSQVLRLLGNLVLTRVLFPEVFGEMALVTIFLVGLQMFTDVGTGPSIIQNERGDDLDFLNTAWTTACIRGTLLWGCSWLIAGPAAAFYHQPLLKWLIPVAAFGTVLNGFESTSMHTLQRHLRLERLTLVELAGQATHIIGAVVLASIDRYFYGPNHPGAVWTVVFAGLTANTTRLILSHTVLPGIRHRFRLERDALHRLLHFGRWIFVSTLLTFLAAQSDRMVVAKLIPLDVFGIYSVAFAMASLPTGAAIKIGTAVVFPAYSRMADRPDFADVFRRVRTPLLLGGGAIASGLIASGPFLIRVLYDARYLSAGWMLQFLAVMAWFQILECTNSAALMAIGRVRWVAVGNASKVVALFLLVPLGFHLMGFPGALAGFILADFLRYLVAAAGAAMRGVQAFANDALLTALVAGVAWIGYATGTALDARYGKFAALAGSGAVAGALSLAMAWRYIRNETALSFSWRGWRPKAAPES